MSFDIYERFLRALVFKMDAEKAHHLALNAIQKGWIKGVTHNDSVLERNLFGIQFKNPVGLAAGFDKDGVALTRWESFGFGFIEVGTVTQHAQPGNPKPRLYRIPGEKAIINRMGFNNAGADVLLKNLERDKPRIPLGINIGKSKITPLEQAADDYAYSYKALLSYGDYFVVNVSSPNTEGLRSLQDKDSLTKIFWRLKEIDSKKPLFVKIAPDLSDPILDEIIEVVADFQLTGVIATNTTISRDTLKKNPNIDGGLSGKPLKEKADLVLEYLKKGMPDDSVLIGVGGIMSGQDAVSKMQKGADLVQIYSGWIYNGIGFPADICKTLAETDPAIPVK